MKEIDFRRAMMHDSAKERYRTPLGAVPAGTSVMLKLAVQDFYFEKAYLVVLRGQYKIEIEMHRDGNMLYAEYDTPSKPCVLWYWFDIHLSQENHIYYGAHAGFTAGVGKVYWGVPPAFQITVHDPAFTTPHWFKGANMYQIFPDRFKCGDPEKMKQGLQYHRDMGRDVVFHEDWNEKPLYQPIEGRTVYSPCDYYGGDLKGIEDSLDYLHELGITVLYLNPIFEAASNHRYNTADYLKIDPVLGKNEDFTRLAKRAEERGMKIILDGVFSHTGDDSVYFNKYGNYPEIGAYQSKDSAYYNWYKFEDYPEGYKSWWGFTTLPEVDETQQDWADFIIQDEDSVINTWLMHGAAGYRLDVADELPDETIEQMRTALKDQSQDNVLLGEVWEDATTKQSYGVNRKYALGRGLDTVMNYPFTNATIDFLRGTKDAGAYKRFLVGQSQNYPKEMYYALMNLLSSHDVARVRTLLGANADPRGMTREQQAHFVVTEEQDARGAQLQRLAAALQFSLPGVPSIYYGDETGMHGLMDPFNRRSFLMIDEEMKEYYRTLSLLRQEHRAFQTGNTVFYAHGADMAGILRFCVDGVDAFDNVVEDEMFLTVVNRADVPQKMVVDLFEEQECLTGDQLKFFRDVELDYAASVFTEERYEFNEGLVGVELPPFGVDILEIFWI